MNRLTIFCTTILALLITSCSVENQVYTDKAMNADLSAYETYAWLPMSDTLKSEMSIYDNDIINNKLMSEVDMQLQERDYDWSPGDPDLLVNIHTMYDQETEVYQEPVYGSYDYYYPAVVYGTYPYYYSGYNTVRYLEGYDIETVEYVEGTIIIDIIEAESRKILWRGWSQRTVNEDDYVYDLKEDVRDIFDKYPVESNVENEMSMR